MQRTLLAAILAAGIFPLHVAAAQACPDYAARLAAMADADQGLRQRIDYLDPDSKPQQELASQVRLVDRANTERFAALMARCGWPTTAVQGGQAVKQAWLLVERGAHDLAFQKAALGLIEAAAGKENLDGRYAELADRVAVAEGRPQLYGTQLDMPRDQPCALFFKPFDSLAQVEARRARLGMGKLYDYLDWVKEMRHCSKQPHYAAAPDASTGK